MRPTTYSDVSCAARALRAVSAPLRGELCTQLFREAEIADRYTRRLGKLHPVWGRGTLAESAARHRLAIEPGFDDRDYCMCVIEVLQHLATRPRSRHL